MLSLPILFSKYYVIVDIFMTHRDCQIASQNGVTDTKQSCYKIKKINFTFIVDTIRDVLIPCI